MYKKLYINSEAERGGGFLFLQKNIEKARLDFLSSSKSIAKQVLEGSDSPFVRHVSINNQNGK